MSGSQINGNFYRPSLPQVNDNRGVQSQGGVRNVQAGDVQQAPDNHPIREVSTQLTQLLNRVSKRSTAPINLADVAKRVHTSKVFSVMPEFAELAEAASAVGMNLRIIGGYTGEKIADCFNPEKGTWGPPLKSPINAVSNQLADLSEKLLNLVNHPAVQADPEMRELLTDKYMTNCCRESEFLSVLMQIVDLKGDGTQPISPEAAEKLSHSVKEWMIELAPHMHGTDNLSVDTDPNMKRLVSLLDEFKGNDSQSIPQEKLQQLRTATLAAKESVHALAEKTTTADRAFFREAEKIFDDVLGKLSGLKTAALESIVTRHLDTCFKLPACLDFSKEFLLQFGGHPECRPLADYIFLRREVHHCAELMAKAKLTGADPKPFLENLKILREKLVTLIAESRVGDDGSLITLGANKLNRLAQVMKKSNPSPLELRNLPQIDNRLLPELFERVKAGDPAQATADIVSSASAITAHAENLLVMMDRCLKSDAETFNTRQLISTLYTREMPISSLVECRANGIRDSDIDLTLCDENIVSRRAFGQGGVNTVYEVTMNDGHTYIFKPEVSGRAGTSFLSVAKGAYENDVNVAALNIAAQQAANYIGCGDMLVASKVGICNGQIGVFMEKAPGVEVHDYTAFQNFGAEAPKGINAVDFNKMDDATFLKTNAQLMKQCYNLEWADFLIGSGDRHTGNYFVDISENNTLKMTGIDNDMTFGKYRTSFTEISLQGKEYKTFVTLCYTLYNRNSDEKAESIEDVANRLKTVPGIELDPENSQIKIDLSKLEHTWIRAAISRTTGMHQLVPPRVIDRAVYDKLMEIDKDPNGLANYRAILEGRMNQANVEAAMKRLQSAIAYAKELKAKGCVIDSWENAQTQKEIYQKHHIQPLKDAKSTEFNEKKTKINQAFVGKHYQRNTGNMYFRDFFYSVKSRLDKITEEDEDSDIGSGVEEAAKAE